MRIIAVAAGVALLVGALVLARTPDVGGSAARPRIAVATWAFRPSTLEEAKAAATDIVLARVAAVEPGPDLVGAAPGEPSGEDRIPTQRVRLQVLERYKGRAPAVVVLFKTGGDGFVLPDDPPYAVGETVLLFLRPRQGGDGSYLVVAPEGRFGVVDGKLVPVVRHGFAAALRGRALAEVAAALRR